MLLFLSALLSIFIFWSGSIIYFLTNIVLFSPFSTGSPSKIDHFPPLSLFPFHVLYQIIDAVWRTAGRNTSTFFLRYFGEILGLTKKWLLDSSILKHQLLSFLPLVTQSCCCIFRRIGRKRCWLAVVSCKWHTEEYTPRRNKNKSFILLFTHVLSFSNNYGYWIKRKRERKEEIRREEKEIIIIVWFFLESSEIEAKYFRMEIYRFDQKYINTPWWFHKNLDFKCVGGILIRRPRFHPRSCLTTTWLHPASQIFISSSRSEMPSVSASSKVVQKALTAAKCGDLKVLESFGKAQSLHDSVVDDFGASCVHYGARSNNVAVLELLVCHLGLSASKRTCVGATPLHDAAASGSLHTLRWLLEEAGVQVDEEDDFGLTAVHLAAKYGHSFVLNWLLEETCCDIMKRSTSGALPLHFAVVGGCLQAVKLLIKEAPR